MCSTFTFVAHIPVCIYKVVSKYVSFLLDNKLYVQNRILIYVCISYTSKYLGKDQDSEERRVPRILIAREDRRDDTSEPNK